MKYYAVRVGRKPGIYTTWPECKEQVDGLKYSRFKSFATVDEAEVFMKQKERRNPPSSAQKPHSKKRVDVNEDSIDQIEHKCCLSDDAIRRIDRAVDIIASRHGREFKVEMNEFNPW